MRNDRLPSGYWIIPALAVGLIAWSILFTIVARLFT